MHRVTDCKATHESMSVSPSPVGMPVALNIGPSPTFAEEKLKVEAHIIGFTGDLYDHDIAIELLAKMREVQKFESKEQLISQLDLDIDRARKIAVQAN